jgi:hypothetical protein
MDLLDCNFDVLQYSRPQLVDLAVLVFEYFNLLESFKISRETLHNFVTSVRASRPCSFLTASTCCSLHPTGAALGLRPASRKISAKNPL